MQGDPDISNVVPRNLTPNPKMPLHIKQAHNAEVYRRRPNKNNIKTVAANIKALKVV